MLLSGCAARGDTVAQGDVVAGPFSVPMPRYVEPIGCSVNVAGNVAVTSFSPGEVFVYVSAKRSNFTIYSDASYEYLWTAGYGGKGNLVGVGEYSTGARRESFALRPSTSSG